MADAGRPTLPPGDYQTPLFYSPQKEEVLNEGRDEIDRSYISL